MKTLKRRILVLGAAGALGRELCVALKDVFGEYLDLYIGDNREERRLQLTASIPGASYREISTQDFENVCDAIEGIDCVIIAFPQNQPIVQHACFFKQIICIDACSFQDMADKVRALQCEKESLSIVMSGFFPGLSGVFAHGLTEEFEEVKEISVGMLHNVNGEVGSAGLEELLKMISSPLDSGQCGFTHKREMSFFHSNFPVREINPDERRILMKKTGVPDVIYWLGWNRPKFTKLVGFLVKHNLLTNVSKMLLKASRRRKPEDERVYLFIRLEGIKNQERHSILTDISAQSSYKSAAFYISMIADKAFISDKKGLRFPFEMMALNDFNYFDYDPYFKIKRYEQELD